MNPIEKRSLGACLAVSAAVLITAPAESTETECVCRYCAEWDEQFEQALDTPTTEPDQNGLHYAPDRKVDVLHIKLNVTPDFGKRTVSGTTSMTFAPILAPLEELQLDAVHLQIDDVRSDDANIADFVSTGQHLTVLFEPAIPVGQQATVHIGHSAQPTQGFYFRTSEMGYPETDTHVWTQGEAHEARHWFPCFDYPNERSSTEVICHVPKEMAVLSNGRLMSEELDAATGLKAVRWLQEKPHVNYLICLVAGYFKTLEQSHRDIPLRFHTQPSLFGHAKNSFRDTRQIMAFFEEEIGVPFPWAKYDQVTIRDFTAGGMENTTLTTLTHRTIFSDASENIRTTRRLDAHEMAHQWFGDYVTCKDWSHLWLNEGFATYYAHLYEGHKFGRDHLLYGLYRDAERSVLPRDEDRRPIAHRGYKSAREQFDYRAYPKGSWVLHMLRSQLGEETYRRCIKTYLERHALGSVVTDDLRQVFEDVTGRSFDRFFNQWVHRARHPDLAVRYQWLPSEKLAKVSVEQTQETNDDVLLFSFPTALRFILEKKTVDHEIEITSKQHDFYVPLPSQPRIVRFDPNYTVLARVAFNKPDQMLAAQLENQDDVIGRLRAVEGLAKRDTHQSVAALKTALNQDPFYGVRIAASSALQKIGSDESFEALAASLDQEDARVRLQVVQDLGRFFRDEAREKAIAVIEAEHNPAVAAEAVKTLARHQGPESRRIILEALRSTSFRNELADAAVQAIRMTRDASYRRPLLKALERREAEFTSRGFSAGLETLAQISREIEDQDDVREFLTEQVFHSKRTVRVAAIRALGTLGDPKSAAVLETFAGDERNTQEANAAKRALESLQEKTPAAPAELVEVRNALTELRQESDKLRRTVDDLKERLEAIATQRSETGDDGEKAPSEEDE